MSDTVNPRFRKVEHLRRRRDFARVFAGHRSVANNVLVVYAFPNELPYSRLGMSVSRRIGNAVCRNHVRRRIREAYRLFKHEWRVGFDFVCVARPQARHPGGDITRSLRELIPRAIRRATESSRGSSPR